MVGPAAGGRGRIPCGAPMDASRIESTTVDGRRLAWRPVGSGPQLLLVNGYAATGADWDSGFLAALAETYEVICPDNRGLGESDPRPDRLTGETMAADRDLVLDAQG